MDALWFEFLSGSWATGWSPLVSPPVFTLNKVEDLES
jgi:hypothetical protein